MTLRRTALLLVLAGCPAALPAQDRVCTGAPSPGVDRLLAHGRFWHAEQVAPPLPAPPRAVPVPLGVLHARIRAGLGKWREVLDVLGRVRGGDTVPAVVDLRAAAAEHLADWSAAEAGYRRVAESVSAPTALRGPALVRRAVALEMLREPDSAAIAWRRAARVFPEIADWLAIRRAARESDTTLAFGTVASPRSPGAALRAALLVAQRRESEGDLDGALDLYRRWERPVDVARVEFALGETRVGRQRADSVLVADPSRPQALLAANLLEARARPLTVAELGGIARVYRAQNDLRAATRVLRRALARADTNVELWLDLSAMLSARRDRRGALAAADTALRRARRSGATLQVQARIEVARVRTWIAARAWETAGPLVDRLVARYPGDSGVARIVLALAEHDRDLSRLSAERTRYALLLARFPAAPATNLARFRVALDLYVRGARDSAAAVLTDVLGRDSAGRLGPGPRFWAARLRLERGDMAGRVVLRRIAEREPLSYYGVRSRDLVNEGLPLLPDSLLPGPAPGALPPDRAAERIRVLMSVGLEQEARDEALGWIGDPTASARTLAAAAAAAADAGLAREAVRLGHAALARGVLSVGVAHGLLPFPFRQVIEGEAAEQCLDPFLLVAIIRHESLFTPNAVSRAGARGLAQVLPSTGRQLARRLGVRRWDPALLFVPDFNLHLGARYVHDRVHREALPVYATLAAYNAGAARVDRWRRWPGFGDPDLFVERVALTETRRYVKNVYASYQWYRRTYGRTAGTPSAAR